MQRRFTVLLILAGLAWLSFMLYYTRFAMLDDALIHLRYATFLHRLHFITFDGVHHSFGTSSLLYVTMLAVLCGVTSSVMLAKIVSVIFYCGVVGLIGWQLRSVQTGSMGRHTLWRTIVYYAFRHVYPMADGWHGDQPGCLCGVIAQHPYRY